MRAGVGPELGGQGLVGCGRELAHGAEPEGLEPLRDRVADPPQRLGRPVAHHLQPGVARSAGRHPVACRGRWRSWRAPWCRRSRSSSAAGSPPAPPPAVPARRRPGRRSRAHERLVPAEHLDHGAAVCVRSVPSRPPTPPRRPGSRPAGRPRRGSASPRSAVPCPTGCRTPALRRTPWRQPPARWGHPGRRPRREARPARVGAAPRPPPGTGPCRRAAPSAPYAHPAGSYRQRRLRALVRRSELVDRVTHPVDPQRVGRAGDAGRASRR